MKLAPVVRAISAAGHRVRLVATGQHHDTDMAGSFFTDLGLEPSVRWQLPAEPAARLGRMMELAEEEVACSGPSLVLLLGDTNTIPAFCLAARRHAVAVAHLEAGLRSFNETSIEEVNRRVAAAAASLHLAPTELARRFLLEEGVPPERIEVVGNPVIDVLRERGLTRTALPERSGVLVTAHRATNVDDPERLWRLVELVRRLATEIGPVTFPVHPRTASRLAENGWSTTLDIDGVSLLGPLPYDAMLEAMRSSRLVVTDSGGVQEEASYFGVPTVVLRSSTPRWEGVLLGTSRLVGLDVEAALAAAAGFNLSAEQERVAAAGCPYGDGHTSERVAALLAEDRVWKMLELREPDLGWLPPALVPVGESGSD